MYRYKTTTETFGHLSAYAEKHVSRAAFADFAVAGSLSVGEWKSGNLLPNLFGVVGTYASENYHIS